MPLAEFGPAIHLGVQSGYSDVAVLTNGTLVAVRADAAGNIFTNHLAENGTSLTGWVEDLSAAAVSAVTTHAPLNVGVTALKNGNYVIGGTSGLFGSTSSQDLYAKVEHADGSAVTSVFEVNTSTNDDQDGLNIAPTSMAGSSRPSQMPASLQRP